MPYGAKRDRWSIKWAVALCLVFAMAPVAGRDAFVIHENTLRAEHGDFAEHELIMKLRAHNNWERISVRVQGLTDRALKTMAALPKLAELQLKANAESHHSTSSRTGRPEITSAGLRALSTNPSLTKIVLSGVDADQVLTAMEKAPAMRHIYIENASKMTDAATSALATMPALRQFSINDSETTKPRSSSVFTPAMARGLAQCAKVEELFLSLAASDDVDWTEFIADMAPLPLKRLGGSSLELNDDTLRKIAAQWPNLDFLSGRPGPLDEEGARALGALESMTHFSVEIPDASPHADGWAKALAIGTFPRLKKIGFSQGLTDEGLSALLSIPAMEELVATSSLLTDQSLLAAPENRHLRTLVLGGKGITAEGLATLGQRFPNLRVFIAMGMDSLSDAALKAITHIQSLEHVVLYDLGKGTSDEGLNAFTSMSHLKKLVLYGGDFTETGKVTFMEKRPDVKLILN